MIPCRLRKVMCMSQIPDISARRGRFLLPYARCLMLLASLLSVMLASAVFASIPNRLYRADIRPKNAFTRITLSLENPPQYSIAELPNNRVRLIFPDTGGTLFRKFRGYSDANIGGLEFSRRGGDLLVTFQMAAGRGWRDNSQNDVAAVTIDVGREFIPPPLRAYRAGREKIWNGVEKLVRDFDPPLKSEFPFVPTDRQILKGLLDDESQIAFMTAESALYKGSLSEAEEAFAQFATRQTAIRSLALYRLGETYYKLQKYPQALASFREAEKLWPAFTNYNPGVTFYYGDSIARSGDLTAARTLLASLIARLADKKYAPVLLVRLADILMRQGHEQEALGVYRTVSENFKDNKATWMALLRLNDRDFLQATPWSFRRLSDVYQEISRQSTDIDLREEAHFKYVLLESLHGEAPEALRQVVLFQKKFPRSVYAAVCRTMREVLVGQVYLQADWDKDAAGLIRFVEEHQDYLSACMDQPDFLTKVAHAYEEAGRPIELIKLFSFLLDRQWASAGAPYLYEAIVENAELLGDTVMEEKYIRAFLRRFPAHSPSRPMLERLGSLYFAAGKHQEVRDTLFWLLNKGERAHTAESYYYLGRSLWVLKQFSPSYKAMEQYLELAAGLGDKASRLLPDAYYVAASAREASGDRTGALRLLEKGLRQPLTAKSEPLLYKAGELNLYAGNKQAARNYFEQVVKNGPDPDWIKLAQQALEALDTKSVPEAAK
jgi:TolA-binding protein